MDLSRLLLHWQSEPAISASIQHWHEIPGRPAITVPLPEKLNPALGAALQAQGIQSIYTHQSASYHHVSNRSNIVVVTGTASGKTLCYNLPVLDRLLSDPQGRALYLFPTKALTQDQASALNGLITKLYQVSSITQDQFPRPSIYDGDTPSSSRPLVRLHARLIFTNPDMLHLGILPHHTSWSSFFSNLRYVILDEAHVYRGVFGSHIANVIRRLQRIARHYGSSPQYILTSATIGNPKEHAERLIGQEVLLVDQDGAARGPKTFLIYNPPIVDEKLGVRRSALHEGSKLAQNLILSSIQTIIFCRSRRSVELILSYLRQQIESVKSTSDHFNDPSTNSISSPSISSTIRGYRSGYLPEKRREIEAGLRSGLVRGVVATNALELGIDIGGLGAALLIGYPGTIAASWQQAGRSGRGSEHSLAVLVTTADPLDQFLASHPEYFFSRSAEQALINPDNPLILLSHLSCAAFELPFQDEESFGQLDARIVEEYLSVLVEQGVLHHSGRKFFWMADQYPSQTISLRSADANPVSLKINAENPQAGTIGQVDRASAYWMVHPNAIYLHEGEVFRVDSLDFDQGIAQLSQVDVDYYTTPQQDTRVDLVEVKENVEVCGGQKSHGDLQVTTRVTGFRKIRWYTHEVIAAEPLDMPNVSMLTTGYWLSLAPLTVDSLRETGIWSGDPIDYGPNWDVQRERTRRRDNYRCQVCQTPETNKAHHVHHIAPFRTFTSFIHANVLENLVTLCPTCHRSVETAVRIRSGLAGLAYLLGNLAPLFLMCDTADIGVHSDPQSPISEGQPTVVIYDHVPAGLGFSQRLFEIHPELIESALGRVNECLCKDGCPSCVGPGGESGVGGKNETLAILKLL